MKNIRLMAFSAMLFTASCFTNTVTAQQQSAADSTIGNINNSANNQTVSRTDSGAGTTTSAAIPISEGEGNNRGNGNWGWLGLLGLLGLFGLRKNTRSSGESYKRESNISTHS